MRIYSIFDLKGDMPVNIFPSVNDATALRSFEQLLFAPEDNFLNQSPGDYIVVFLGEFNTHDDYEQSNVIGYGNSYSESIIQSRREDLMRKRVSIINASKEASKNGE